MQYELSEVAIVKKDPHFGSKNKILQPNKAIAAFQTKTSNNDFDNKQGAKEGNEYETGGSLQFLAHKQAVIEFNHVAPSKVMTMEPGVELIEKGKNFKGDYYAVEGKFRLTDYRKLHDPRVQ